LQGDESWVGFKRGQRFNRGKGSGLELLEEGLSGFSWSNLALSQFILGSAFAFALSSTVLGRRVIEKGVLLEESQQVVVRVTHCNKNNNWMRFASTRTNYI
jgi:hypothetical protein